ncbi:MAG: Mur ligase family protein [Xanthomonadales bacterium]|nr:Mur ligase family protein [Xanthomonadales bacterium]
MFELTDSRRLTGPNLFSDDPGAVAEVNGPANTPVAPVDGDPATLAERWRHHALALTQALGWGSRVISRAFSGGVSQYLSAPVDVLYAATEVNEAAWAACSAELTGQPAPDFDRALDRLRGLVAEEQNPALLELKAAASQRRARFLSDDDFASVGYGPGALTWPVDQLPAPGDVAWDSVSNIPVGLVTGTNGKSTTVRLAASVLTAAGRQTGVTSTDYIRVADEIIDTGDYSGPGGARTLLRDQRVEVAVLEVARGGMLRRGLGVNQADAAVVTNVAADHLGEWGINSVAEMATAKFIVCRALPPGKPLILNAEDPASVEQARQAPANTKTIVWFSERENHPLVQSHCMNGGQAWVVSSGMITRIHQGQPVAVVPVADVPVTLGGAAKYNVQNALAAAALCHALGATDQAIAHGLASFRGTPEENPGRGNFFEGKGIRVLVDFAHNEHGLTAIAETLARIPAKRRLVMIGQAGDRTDELIADLVKAALKAGPDHLMVVKLPGYERGRQPEDVPRLIHQLALEGGLSEARIEHAEDPVDGTRRALAWAREGDFLLLLALTQRGPCLNLVQRELGQTG